MARSRGPTTGAWIDIEEQLLKKSLAQTLGQLFKLKSQKLKSKGGVPGRLPQKANAGKGEIHE